MFALRREFVHLEVKAGESYESDVKFLISFSLKESSHLPSLAKNAGPQNDFANFRASDREIREIVLQANRSPAIKVGLS